MAHAMVVPARMTDHLETIAVQATKARRVVGMEPVQRLWSGYGQIVRCHLEGASVPSVIVKHVRWPDHDHHPRGWSSDRSHERKVTSYRVESAWYRRYAERCSPACRVPRCLELQTQGHEVFMVLEDLDASGYGARRTRVTDAELKACLHWLADFHATFLGEVPEDLWPTGTYWHLATRPDELEALDDPALRDAAPALDHALSATPFKTFVHGDAKLANFCFGPDGRTVAAVDFQYVGGGCGMKDVAYFISSCLEEDDCERLEHSLLDVYFEALGRALERHGKDVDVTALEADWRALYPIAWTDFFRFLRGWSPGHWKIHGYSARLAREVLESL